jgi:hypothetical protein
MESIASNKITVFKSLLQKYRIYLLFSAKVIISAGLIWYLITKINIAEIVSAFYQSTLPLLIISSLLVIINIYLQYWKWKLTCNFLLGERDRRKILYSLLYGFSAGAFTPLRIGEYFGRAMVLRGNTFTEVTAATLTDKLFSFIILTVTGTAASILFIHFYYGVTFYLTASLFTLIFIFFYLLIFFLLKPEFWNSISSWFRKYRRLNEIFIRLSVLKNLDRNFSIKILAVSFLFYLCYLTQYVLFVSAFSGNYNIWNYIWAGSLMIFSKALIPPVTLSEIGIREGASIFFLTRLGETAPAAFNASVFLFLVNVLFPAVIGMFLLFGNSAGKYFQTASEKTDV